MASAVVGAIAMLVLFMPFTTTLVGQHGPDYVTCPSGLAGSALVDSKAVDRQPSEDELAEWRGRERVPYTAHLEDRPTSPWIEKSRTCQDEARARIRNGGMIWALVVFGVGRAVALRRRRGLADAPTLEDGSLTASG